MSLKKMIGEILEDLQLVTKKQLESALKKQEEISEEKILPERLKRTQIVREARFTGKADAIPLLGEILIDMGLVTKDQLKDALRKQEDMLEKYCTLESNSLCSVMDMGAMVNSSLNLAEVLSHIMKSANKVTRSVASTLMLLEEKTGELIFSVPTGPHGERLMDIKLPKDKGIAGWVAVHDQAVIIPDVNKDQRFYTGIDEITGFKTKSILSVPLKTKSKMIGVLEVINKEDDTPFTEEDALLLTIFATQAAMAIENARLYQELRARLEDEKRLQDKLVESNKFLALGQMASGIAHDFNNILSGIMGFTELATMDIAEDHSSQQKLAQVIQASHRAKEVVNQILAFARQHELERKPIDLKNIFEETLKFLRASLPSNIKIHPHFTDEPCIVTADDTMIHQIVINLCTNAQHAMRDEGGILELSLYPLDIDTVSGETIDDLKPGAYVKFSVSDTGKGMDNDTMKRIYDPYFSTKEKGLGTGLGLSVVHGIVKSHGGVIKVQSEVGGGTRFDIYFPRIVNEVLGEIEHYQELPRGEEQILFVDDEDMLTDLGTQMLERLGYRVLANTNPRSALETFKARKDSIDLVITDMTMPQMSGVELSKGLMKVKPDIPIILCTGFNEQITEEKAKKIGICAFLMKPIRHRDLANTVRKALDKK